MDDCSAVVVDTVSGLPVGAVADLLRGQGQSWRKTSPVARMKVQMRVAVDGKLRGDVGVDADLPVLFWKWCSVL